MSIDFTLQNALHFAFLNDCCSEAEVSEQLSNRPTDKGVKENGK
jgi:hypothetical protein